ncbi:hypothetical protein DYU11_21125 [Fibrisoma montanum]|uniref:Uncharacterized protein n=1 Tax=Fibrisoma montanum TaxID=2305895 RepID=A0A418M489_9BACT|nr:hypothetical protein [Fibrisoma montanum]RIV20550.1 hypothetical protein DYU11_21125 [Fibrisoma montanum]
MESQNPNPFSLAQYILFNPESKSDLAMYTSNPAAGELMIKLQLYFAELVLTNTLRKHVEANLNDHTTLHRLMAQKADELLPGDTIGDLLAKHHAVCRIVDSIFSTTKSMIREKSRDSVDDLFEMLRRK